MANTKESILYLVVRYSDERPFGEYGVCDKFTVVFASMDRDKAEQAMLGAEFEVEMHNNEIDLNIMDQVQRLKQQELARSTLPFDEEATFDRLKRNYLDEYTRCSFSIVEIKLDTRYDSGKEPALGGSWYIE